MLRGIRLVDGGQNYINFLLQDDLIVWSFPNLKEGWRGTRVLNTEFSPGGDFHVLFHNGYDMPLPHLIADAAELDPAQLMYLGIPLGPYSDDALGPQQSEG